MTAANVVPFRMGGLISTERPEYQADLFKNTESGGRYFCFLDVDVLDQGSLLSVVAKNSVHTVVDLRVLPFFDRPKFNHKSLMSYFRDQRVMYLEYAVAVRSPSMFSQLHRDEAEPLGLSLWLYDDTTISVGWYDHVRRAMKDTQLFDAEVPSRTLEQRA
ncbi:hypothetical protein D3C80_733350 [compost metagenome]